MQCNNLQKNIGKEKERKAKDEVKRQRRMRKYSKKDDSSQARLAYSRHDGGISPDELNEDISPEHLDELKQGFYQTKQVATPREVTQIENDTRQQADCTEWLIERRKRITASMVGGLWCTAKREYQTYQQQHGHPGLAVDSSGLFISLDDPWLAASPDGLVNDLSDASHPVGLVEIKNPHSA